MCSDQLRIPDFAFPITYFYALYNLFMLQLYDMLRLFERSKSHLLFVENTDIHMS